MTPAGGEPTPAKLAAFCDSQYFDRQGLSRAVILASDVDGPGAGPVDTTRDFNARPVTTMHLRPSSAVGALCVHSDPPFLASEARLSFAGLLVLQFRHADARMKNGASQCIL